MKLSSWITDNVTELLVKIIEFTRARRKLIGKNIYNVRNPGFVPRDLPVDEFSESLIGAIIEHIQCHRLLLRDTENVKFGKDGSFQTEPIVDNYARGLLGENKDKYLELQIKRLLENTLNQKVANELLRQKQEIISIR